MRKIAKNYKVFVLDFGYAGDKRNFSLVLRHSTGFAPWDALKDIGRAFLESCGNAEITLSDLERLILGFMESGGTFTTNHITDGLRRHGWEIGVGDKNPFAKGFVHVSCCAESLIAAAALELASGESYRTDGQDKIKIR